MSKTFKIVLILLVVASIVSAVLAVFAFVGKEREYMKRILIEDKLAATLKDKRRLEKEIKVTEKAKGDAEIKVKELEGEVKELSFQIEEVKDKNKMAVMDLAAKKKAIEDLKGSLDKERKEKLVISKRLEELQFDYDKAKSNVLRLKNEKMKLEDKISDLKEKSVDLDTIVVSPAGSASSVPPGPIREALEGSVLVVNREYNFLVTDLGKNDGIAKGMVFDIRGNGRLLGKAEIDKIYNTMSSASILPGSDINNIKKGNLIVESR